MTERVVSCSLRHDRRETDCGDHDLPRLSDGSVDSMLSSAVPTAGCGADEGLLGAGNGAGVAAEGAQASGAEAMRPRNGSVA